MTDELLLVRPADPIDARTEGAHAISYRAPDSWVAPRWREGLRVFEGLLELDPVFGLVEASRAARAWHGSFAILVLGRRFSIIRAGKVIAAVRRPNASKLEAAFVAGARRIPAMIQREIDEQGTQSLVEEAFALEILDEIETPPTLDELQEAREFIQTGALGMRGPTFLRLVVDEIARRATAVLRGPVGERRMICLECPTTGSVDEFDKAGIGSCPSCSSRQVRLEL